jgi:N-acetylglucosamine malate deacetylase 1
MKPKSKSKPQSKQLRMLAFGAHPDDIEIGCGGSLAEIGNRSPVHIEWVILTSGGEGSLVLKPQELAKIREAEALNAAECFGVTQVHFLRQAEGDAFKKSALLQTIGIIRKVRPDVIWVHSGIEARGDHRRTHALVMEAVELASGPWYQMCGKPHSGFTVLGYEVWTPIPFPGVRIDINRGMPIKLKALRCHRSQVVEFPYEKAVKGLAQYRAANMGKTGYAEAFEVILVGSGIELLSLTHFQLPF